MSNMSELSPFLLNFMGQVVLVTTSQSATSTAMTPEGPIVETAPMFYEGILLDEDEHFIYLAKKIDQITMAIDRKHIVGIEIVEAQPERDIYTEILDQMSGPSNDEEVN